MGKIVVTTNISLDGVVEDPDGREGSSHGGRFGQFGSQDLEGWAKVETDDTRHSTPRPSFWAARATSGLPLYG